MKKRFFNIVTTTGLFAFIFIFLFNTKRYSEVALEGLRIFYLNVLPCLFPFFVISKLLVEFNCLDNFYKVFYPVTRRFVAEKEGAYVFLISLVSGNTKIKKTGVTESLIVTQYNAAIHSIE